MKFYTASMCRTLILLGTVAGIVCVAGCKTPFKAGTRIESYPSTQIIKNSRLVAKRLEVTSAVKGVTESGIMRVQIDALNRCGREFQMEYRFRWLQKEGFVEKTGLSGWNMVHVGARDTVHMSGIAPNDRVTDYIFVVRFPDRI